MAELTESEKKMLREHAIKHGLSTRDLQHGLRIGTTIPQPQAVAALSELLLAAKEKAAQIAEIEGAVPREEGGTIQRADACDNVARELRNSDWSDLFKEKV